jgi:hypothetical protein
MNCGTRNLLLSGQNELQEIINEISLFFNNSNSIELSEQFKNKIINQIEQGNINLSRNNYLKKNDFDKNLDIITLLDLPHKVVSSAYGCIHDFYDNETAHNSWNHNLAIFNPNLLNSGLNQKTLQIIEKYYNGLSYKTTHKLTDIWINNQIEVDNLLNNYISNYSFPIINYTITRYDEDNNNNDISAIRLFLNKYNIEPKRIVWVVDTFPSWLINISSNKLNMKGSIADIDGASSSLEGNFNSNELIGNFNEIQVGHLKFNIYMNDNAKLPVGIYDIRNNKYIANADKNASVQKIINTITKEYPDTDFSKANRSNTINTYDIQFLSNFAFDEHLLILEYIKAGGDQAPIDIAEKIVEKIDSPDGNYNKYIFWFTTGDELAFELAKSRGIAALYISSKFIKISIPTSMTNPDVRLPTIINFFSKFEKMKLFFNVFNVSELNQRNPFKEMIEYINKISNYSISGKIFASKTIERLKEYFIKSNNNIEKIIQAIHLLSNSFTTENYSDFYKYIEKNLNNIDFNIDGIYDFLFYGDEYNYTFSLEETRQFNKINISREEIISEPTTDIPIVSFCDNYLQYGEKSKIDNSLDCSKENDVVLLKENAVDYLKNVCSNNENMNECMNSRFVLLKTPIKKGKTPTNTNDVITELTLHENWLLIGENYYFSGGKWILLPKNPYTNVTIDILRILVKNRTIIELLHDIPMEIFNIDFQEQGIVKQAMERIIYIFKILQLSLENLEIDNSYLSNNIECIFVDFLLCPIVELEAKKGLGFQYETTPVTFNTRRTKIDVTTEFTQNFLKNIYRIYNIPSIINDVINTIDISNFKNYYYNDTSDYLNNLTSNLNSKVLINPSINDDYQYIMNYNNVLNNYESNYKTFIDFQSTFYQTGGKKTKQNNRTKKNKHKKTKTKTKTKTKPKKQSKSNKTNKKR